MVFHQRLWILIVGFMEPIPFQRGRINFSIQCYLLLLALYETLSITLFIEFVYEINEYVEIR